MQRCLYPSEMLLLAVFTTAVYSTAGQENCQSTHSISDHALAGHVFKTVSKKQLLNCIITCQDNAECEGINYQLATRKCELNNATQDSFHRHLVPRIGWFYLETLNQLRMPNMTCNHVTCNNGGTCFNTSWWPGYHCKCNANYTGPFCQQCKPEAALGMENGKILDSQITAKVHTPPYVAKHARLNNPTSCWRAVPRLAPKHDYYLQIEFNRETMVTGVATQGDPTGENWIMSYTITYKYGSSGKKRNYFRNGKEAVLTGNHDSTHISTEILDPPIVTGQIRLYPLKIHNDYALRVELYGCEVLRPL